MNSNEPATVFQAAKVLAELGNAGRTTMQRLAGGIAYDISRADLTKLTRFDLCRFLGVKIPFFVHGTSKCLEHEISIDNRTPLAAHMAKVGGDNFGKLEEKGLGPDKAPFFVVSQDGYPTLEKIRKEVRAYDLKLATAREMASFSIQMQGVWANCLTGALFLLCGMDEFCPPRWNHLLFFPCSVDGRLNSLEHKCGHQESYVGERSDGWQESPRRYLVRRMTHEEIAAREDLK